MMRFISPPACRQVYFLQSFKQRMGITPMSFYAAEGMFTYGLSSLVILRIFFDVVIIYINGILIFTSLDNAVRKFSTLAF